MVSKKDRVLEAGKKSNEKLVWVGLVATAILIGGVYLLFGNGGEVMTDAGIGIEPMSYKGLRVDKRIITPIEEGGLIGANLEDLNEYRMVYFRYGNKPVLIYGDQKGEIIASIAMCEPCKNDEKFFIQDNLLVCGKCWTKWKLGSHAGVSGGCKEYPPDIMSYEIKNDEVLVKKSDIEDWVPRVWG